MKLITVLLVLASSIASAEIFEYVDPVTGAKEFTNQPKPGALLVSVGDERKLFAASFKAREKERVKNEKAARSELTKLYPKECPTHERCEIVPGMPVDTVVKAFTLTPAGFTHNAQGKTERFKRGGCVISGVNERVVSIDC